MLQKLIAGVKQHPKGLFYLFATEAGERHSYYGTRALLVLYMLFLFKANPEQLIGYAQIKWMLEGIFGALSDQALASQIYGIYTALCYFTTIIGGMIADRYLGQRKSVFVGGIVMAVGHLVLAFQSTFFVGILLLVLGNGMFKPNISTQVGALYPDPKDPRRDKAFGIFYMGINLGAFFSPLVCGTLGQKVGWRWGFVAASVVMCISTLIYLWGQKHLAPDKLKKKDKATRKPLTRDDWTRIKALAGLCALNIPFWAIYEQQGNTMQLWADQQTVWPTVFGWQMPSTWFQAFNPMVVFVGMPLIIAFWGWQNRRGKEPSTVAKMATGCFLLGASFIVMIAGAHIVGNDKGNVLWLFTCTAMLTVGELYLSPMGISLVTKIAPARVVSTMMGVWFLSSFFGNYLSGFIGSYYERMPRTAFFGMLTVIGCIAGLSIMAFTKPLEKAMEQKTEAAKE